MIKLFFCDNSNYDYDFSKLKIISDKSGKTIEFLKFEGDEKTSIFGKGYGEGEIIKYAIENSELLKNESCFYKVTGRLIVKNFDLFSYFNKNNKNIFFSPTKKVVDTRFFKVEKSFYVNYLLDEYKKVNDSKGYYLEHVYYEKLKNLKPKLSKSFIFPNIAGVSGSTGEEYKNNFLKLIIKNIKLIIGGYNI